MDESVTGLSDCSANGVCDDILGQSLLNDGEALTPDTKSIAVRELPHDYQDSVSQILQDTFISPNGHDCSKGRAAPGFNCYCARGDSDLSNQSIFSSSETLIYGTDAESACSLSDISQEDISSSSQGTVIYSEIKVLSLNTGGLRSKDNKVSKGAKISNRYNQVPHLTQYTNGKVTNSQ